MKPVIGLTPDYNGGDRQDMGGKEPTYFLRARYLQAIENSGGIPLMLPLITKKGELRQILSSLDGLLITGSGSDLAPELYGERQRYKFRRMAKERSSLELELTKLAYKANIPVLGICGGMQSMNVALGGTLFQDIASQLTTTVPHQPPFSATKPAHKVSISPKSLLNRITKQSSMAVNSSHHQSIKKVAPPLTQTATAPDGVIEAIESPSLSFFLGVQWHPEFMYSRYPLQNRLFQALIHAARRYRRPLSL